MDNQTKQSLENIKTCLNDVHDRLSALESKQSNKHSFYNKSSEGYWMVKCWKTGGAFCTTLWKLEVVKPQVCPCCGETIRRQTK